MVLATVLTSTPKQINAVEGCTTSKSCNKNNF